MTFDITQRRAVEKGDIELKNGDGSPFLDDDGNQLTVTVHSPGSKVWQQATNEKQRKTTERVRKNGGKIEAVVDHQIDDQVEFLCRVTISFNWEYALEKGETAADYIRKTYADPTLGFIRDHVFAEVNDWAAFTKGSAKS